jgi:hypothetical protein
MRKLLTLTVLTAALAGLAGCNTCRNMTSGWFNHGDRCNPPPPADYCPPGGQRAQMMYPGTTTVLPGAIEVSPQ